MSMAAVSLTFRIHVPLAIWPENADSGCAGLKLPCQGFPEELMFWMEVAAESVRMVSQKLLPLLPAPPGCEKSWTFVPVGEVSVADRSPTNVWSMPTVV